MAPRNGGKNKQKNKQCERLYHWTKRQYKTIYVPKFNGKVQKLGENVFHQISRIVCS